MLPGIESKNDTPNANHDHSNPRITSLTRHRIAIILGFYYYKFRLLIPVS